MLDYRELIGVPFVNGGRSPQEGFDCWGLSRYIYEHYHNIILPDYRIDCYNASAVNANILEEAKKKWRRIEEPIVPCVIVMRFNSPISNHVGTYLGNGDFIHTAEKMGVNINSIYHVYWKRHIDGFYVPND